MRYISTRDPNAVGLPFSDVLLTGLAPDGGLYVPQTYPQLSDELLDSWRGVLRDQGYAALAAEVLKLFIDDIPAPDIEALTRRAYTEEAFGDPEIVPVTRLGGSNVWLAHLSNGPTAAFKDMAMQLLGQFFDYELARRGGTLTVLGATSGDTGSAAEYAMLGKEHVRVVMLTPRGRMTEFQQAQMFSITDTHIANIAIDGVFDDCQDLVKTLNMDADFKATTHLGSVNSMNWGRLVAQVVYYIASYLRVTYSNDTEVTFAVPTGNFGNILAGHIAAEMGLPIRTLLLATNENNVLAEFFETGVYRPRGAAETLATSSPSMDISKASNFERFIFDLVGRDATRTADLFHTQLNEQGFFDLSETAEFEHLNERYGFVALASTHEDRIDTIREVFNDYQVLVDPHTADALGPALGFAGITDTPIIVIETALPVKFAATIEEAVGFTPPVPPRFATQLDGPRRVTDLPDDPDALKRWVTDWLSF
ncbi:MAG: threonine synthase [Propionibacteriaceae bacterium]|jgi:threonine synthase|nr:threonine synthase [Propionibacteriaceae bacterium]